MNDSIPTSELLDSSIEQHNDVDLSVEDRDRLTKIYGLSDSIITSRGYRTVVRKTHAEEYVAAGLGALVKFMPALELPIWTFATDDDGRTILKPVSVQLRPHKPRTTSNGKVNKFENVPHEPLRLDIHPNNEQRVQSSERLWVVEGIAKGDALTTHGRVAIALQGVWGYKGRGLRGGITALDAWNYVHLPKREVVVCFDSDCATKLQVQRARLALARFLQSKRAEVYVVDLPEVADGSKVGVDDYLRTRSPEELEALIKPFEFNSTPRVLPEQSFDVIEGRHCAIHSGDDGPTATPLCDFQATIDRVIIEDDGANKPQKFFELSGIGATGLPLPKATVEASIFDGMSWVTTEWAGSATYLAGRSVKELLRASLHVLSPQPIPQEIRYTHTGWRRFGNAWRYLSASGALGEDGMDQTIRVRLEGRDKLFALHDVALDSEEVRNAVNASLGLATIGKSSTMLTLLGLTYLAPLASEVLPVTFSGFLNGATGTFKTELAALCQAHFGEDFRATALPDSWQSTRLSIERHLFNLKDALVVLDDFHPPLDSVRVARELQDKAEYVLRGAGNTAGRGRLDTLANPRPMYYPRGFVLATGEEIPQGASLQARLLPLHHLKGDIGAKELTIAQRERHNYVIAMSAYVKWLASQIQTLKDTKTLERHHEDLRSQLMATLSEGHKRTASILAAVLVALETVTRFAVEIRAIDESTRTDMIAEHRAAVCDSARRQAEDLGNQNPAVQFIEEVQNALQAGHAHFASTKVPGYETGLERFGWRADEYASRPRGDCIGYVDFEKRRVYLASGPSYNFVAEQLRRRNRNLPPKNELFAALVQEGFAESAATKDKPNGTTRQIRVPDSVSKPTVLMLTDKAMPLDNSGDAPAQVSASMSSGSGEDDY